MTAEGWIGEGAGDLQRLRWLGACGFRERYRMPGDGLEKGIIYNSAEVATPP